MDGSVGRELNLHQSELGLNPGSSVIVGFRLAPKGFFVLMGIPVFHPHKKTTLLYSSSIRKQCTNSHALNVPLLIVIFTHFPRENFYTICRLLQKCNYKHFKRKVLLRRTDTRLSTPLNLHAGAYP